MNVLLSAKSAELERNEIDIAYIVILDGLESPSLLYLKGDLMCGRSIQVFKYQVRIPY